MLYRYTYPQKLTYNKPASILDWTVTYELYDPLFAYFSSVNDIVSYTLTNKSKDFTILYKQFVGFDQTTRKLTFKLAPMNPSTSDGCEFNISLDLDCTINTDQENILLNHYEDNNTSLYNKGLIPRQSDEIICYNYFYQYGTAESSKLFLSSTNRCSYDSWVNTDTITNYRENNISLKTIKPGTAPAFTKKLMEFFTPGFYRISRTDSRLTFYKHTGTAWSNVKSYSKSSFDQGIIPSKIIAAFQGPGGGGSGHQVEAQTYASAGGASGAFCLFVLDFTTLNTQDYYFEVGEGGAYKPSTSTYDDTESTILYKDSDKQDIILTVGGGQGSYTYRLVNQVIAHPGLGGKVTVNSSIFSYIQVLFQSTGTDSAAWSETFGSDPQRLGALGKTAIGSKYSTKYLPLQGLPESRFSFLTTSGDTQRDETKYYHEGGLCHPNARGGGGGAASYFAEGGDGGTGSGGSTNAKPGKYGSGGGAQGDGDGGDGRGGDGFAVFYY